MEELKNLEGISCEGSSVDAFSVEHPATNLEPHASLVADENEKVVANDQLITSVEEIHISSSQGVPTGKSLEQKTISSETLDATRSDVADFVSGSSEDHSVPETCSVNTLREQQKNMRQAEEQVGVTSSVELGRAKDTSCMIPSELNQCQVEVQNEENKSSMPINADDITYFPNVPDVQTNAHCNSSHEIGKTDDNRHALATKPGQHPVKTANLQQKTLLSPDPSDRVNLAATYRALVDTAAPFESVREAVTKFGGTVDWKAHKAQTLERRKHVQLELQKVQEEIPEFKKQLEFAEDAKAQVLSQLDNTKRLVEELKLNVEKAQTEEAQAKQDSEFAQLRIQEIEQGISDEASVAAKSQLEVLKARHATAVVELKSTKEELEKLRGEYISLVRERDAAIRKARDAVSTSKECVQTVGKLTLELLMAKESLESAHGAHLEAEEHRIGTVLAEAQDVLTWQKELKQAEKEVQRLNEQLLLTKDLQSKFDMASALLLDLKSELATYMEAKLKQESEGIEEVMQSDEEDTKKKRLSILATLASTKNELEEVKSKLEQVKNDVEILRVATSFLMSELDSEKAALSTLRQLEEMISMALLSLEAELDGTKAEIEFIRTKEKETREKMVELPKLLQQAAQEADHAKSACQQTQEELWRIKEEEEEEAKACANTAERRFHATLKEIEAAKASEKLVFAAIKALQESEQAAIVANEATPIGVTFPLEEYYKLTKKAYEAEELAKEQVTAAIVEIQVAKDSEAKSLEMLQEATKELNEKKKALSAALKKAEKAKEEKLGAEQELRKWRTEHEQRRRANDNGTPPKSIEYSRESKRLTIDNASAMFYTSGNDTKSEVPKVKVRKKRSLLPRIIMFLAPKKAVIVMRKF